MLRRIFYYVFAFMCLAGAALADSQGSATGGTAGTQSTGAGCIRQTPSLSAGQQATLSCDATGKLQIGGSVTDVPQVGTTFAPVQVALNSSTTTQILATLATPSGRNVCNLDTAINIFIGPIGVTSSTGIKLLPGACWDMAHTTAAIYGISASATPTAAGVQY